MRERRTNMESQGVIGRYGSHYIYPFTAGALFGFRRERWWRYSLTHRRARRPWGSSSQQNSLPLYEIEYTAVSNCVQRSAGSVDAHLVVDEGHAYGERQSAGAGRLCSPLN